MEHFIHNANVALYRRLLAESKRDPSRNEDRHNILLRLLAEEEAKDERPRVAGVALDRPDQGAVYYPEELSLLGQILDQAMQLLPLSMRTPQNRAAIAKNILACAATGERDPIELRLAALINLKVTVAA